MSITKILQGINRCEVEYTDGWWETESGATFGHSKLIEAQGYECGLLQRITELKAQLADAKKDAEQYQWLRGNGLKHIDFKGLSDETCDVGLDYTIDAAIQAEGKQA